MTRRVCVLVNPASGRGRGAKLDADVRRIFAGMGVHDVRTTAAKGDEQRLAAAAIADGADTLVAVGGDGTWSNVANAILASGADVRLALLAAGTGNDFAKTVGAPAGDIAATARLAVEGGDIRTDAGRIEGRYFLNVAGFGFDIAVLEDIDRIRWLRGDALYAYSAFRQLFGYPGISVDLASGGTRRGPASHLMLIIANGQNFGGTFRIAPAATVTDGRLDAVSILAASPLRRMQLFAAAARGTHVGHPEVVSEQAGAFTLVFDAPPAYETDGEYRRAGSAELEITCVPRALRVVVPDGAQPAARR